jgi:hypothetical protein
LTTAERRKLRSEGLINYHQGEKSSKVYFVESKVWDFLDEIQQKKDVGV